MINDENGTYFKPAVVHFQTHISVFGTRSSLLRISHAHVPDMSYILLSSTVPGTMHTINDIKALKILKLYCFHVLIKLNNE